jgi:high-affinity iron transporter
MAADAIDSGAGSGSAAGRAMVVMAGLAVLREGFETVVFLLAAFNESDSGPSAVVGALLGILLAVGLGYGIYRGGVRLNLSKFFRATGLVLVFVAAGLVVNALHTAHEAGWLNSGQGGTVDLTWLVRPGSVQSSLLTGMLGVQAKPVVIETLGWLVYLIPVGLYVAWPPGRALARRTTSRVLLAAGAALAVAAVVLSVVAPSRPAEPSALATGTSHQVGEAGMSATVLAEPGGQPAMRLSGPPGQVRPAVALRRTDSIVQGGVTLDVWSAQTTVQQGGLHTATYSVIANLNGGRFPIGFHPVAAGTGSLRYTEVVSYRVLVEPRTSRVIDATVDQKIQATLIDNGRELPLSGVVARFDQTTPTASVVSGLRAARHDVRALDDRSALFGIAWFTGVLASLSLLAGAALGLRRPPAANPAVPSSTPAGTLVRS